MQQVKKTGSLLVSLGLLGLSLLALWHRQDIADWWRLRDYTPPPEIAALAEHTSMTEEGKKLFYVHYPELQDSQEFNRSCTIAEESIVLGCYITHTAIYLYDVKEDRLQGIREVTAAHEMLHAAYDRLDEQEKEDLDYKLIAYYDKIKKDNERLRRVIETYSERDLSIVGNELHSILPTEVRELPDDLEQYYARYFTNRLKVVEYSEQYEDVFTRQQQRIQSLTTQIENLENSLSSRKVSIDSLLSQIQSESERLTSLRSQNRVEEYNAAVPGYNAMVNDYKNRVSSYNRDVQRLNSLIEEYNSTAVRQKELYNAIDSRQQEL